MLCNSESAWADETRSPGESFTTNEVMTPKEVDKAKTGLDRIIGFWESPEGKASLNDYFEREKVKKEIRKIQRKRIISYYKSLDKKGRKELIDKFLKWEEKYEDYWYMKRHTQTTSILWTLFTDHIVKKGKDVYKKYSDEDFLGSAHQYKKWTLKTYCGQGCFDRLFYNGEEVFQTT